MTYQSCRSLSSLIDGGSARTSRATPPIPPIARRLRGASGLGWAALLAMVIGACGGKVVIEEGSGGGGGSSGRGSSSAGSSQSTSSGEPGYDCMISPPDGYSVEYACTAIPVSDGCPEMGSDYVLKEMFSALHWVMCDDTGCCTENYVAEVVCGPDPTQKGACCYSALTTIATSCP